MGLELFINNPDNGKIFISALLGMIIGLEREISGKDPSLRTFCLICMGSCTFSVISAGMVASQGVVDPGRIAAQIVVGIGFLGAGTIYRSRNGISGLTTAALMWVTAAIGTAVGFGHIATAVSVTLISIAVMLLLGSLHRLIYFARRNGSENHE